MRTLLWRPLSLACSPPPPCSSRPSSPLTSQPGPCLSPSWGDRFAGSASCLWSSQPTHQIQRAHGLGFDAITLQWLLSPLSLQVLGKHNVYQLLTLPGPPASQCWLSHWLTLRPPGLGPSSGQRTPTCGHSWEFHVARGSQQVLNISVSFLHGNMTDTKRKKINPLMKLLWP